MAGATGLEPATSGVTGRRSKPTELRPRGLDPGGHSYPLRLEGVKQARSTRAEVRAEKAALRHLDHLEPALNAF